MPASKVRFIIATLGLMILFSNLAQPIAAQDDQPPDLKAFDAAMELTDPKQKLDAFANFIRTFGGSRYGAGARAIYLDIVFKNWAGKNDKILEYANKLIDATPDEQKPDAYNDVSDKMLTTDTMLDKAEEMALKGIDVLNEMLAKRDREERAINLTTLGEVYLKRGKVAEAKKAFMEALAGDPEQRVAATNMAKIEVDAHNDASAMNFLVPIALGGRMTAEDRQLLETIYRRAKGGSLQGFEEMLDAEYEKRFANPIKVEAYKSSTPRSDRVVLAEIFSSASCRPCIAADLSFDSAMKRYERKDVIVLMYHMHIPAPDPMANPSTQARAKFYGIRGTPTSILDGLSLKMGGGFREHTVSFYNRVYPLIDERLETPARAEVRVSANVEGPLVKVKATVDKVKTGSSNLKLHIALVENLLRYSGESSIRFHPMVVRSLAGPNAEGFTVAGAAPVSVEHAFDLTKLDSDLKVYLDDFEAKLKERNYTFRDKMLPIKHDNLSVVAFVQDMSSKQVLQATYINLKP
jgi:tetratricopeptide (TPR) repeat protein